MSQTIASPPTAVMNAAPTPGPSQVDNRNLVLAAAKGNQQALETMIRSFVPADERVIESAFLGTFGGILRHRAFFAVTDRRAVSIIVGPYRRFSYTDGLLEHINSSGIEQPSRGPLYAKLTAITVLTLGLGLLLAPQISRKWYRKNKAGLFLNIRESAPIVTFVDAATLPTAVGLYRQFSLARDDRLATLALSAA